MSCDPYQTSVGNWGRGGRPRPYFRVFRSTDFDVMANCPEGYYVEVLFDDRTIKTFGPFASDNDARNYGQTWMRAE